MLGDLISAGAKLIGGYMDSKNADKNRELQQQQMKQQLDFAQSGIQWKVADAKAAGVHPLYALGASTHSFAPISVGSTDPGWGRTLAGMGQDIGRAVQSTQSAPDRNNAMLTTLQGLQLENAKLDTEIKKTDLASRVMRLKQQSNPPMPSPSDTVPEAKKFEDRPMIMLGGQKVATDPLTTNVEDSEKRYGDDGPVTWLQGIYNAWRDYQATTNGGHTQKQLAQRIWEGLKAIDRYTDFTAGFRSR